MSIEQTRAEVLSKVWQAIAQSGVDLSSVPKEQQEKLVGAIADQMLITMDGIIDQVAAPESVRASEEEDEFGETVLWEGRPFLSLVESYVITNERLKIVKGLLSRDVENFELIRIQDIDLKQGVNDRLIGIGDIVVRGHDPSDPKVMLRNVSKPEKVYEILRRAWLDARKRHGLQFREYM